jgi:DNA-cytosine methyltransferase
MQKIKVLSLFDGISIAQQAFKELGFEVEYYASEIDKYAIAVTQNIFPNTIQLGDVCKIKKEMVGNIDLIIGGSPCTDLSIAKKNRQGLKGEQSKLFYQFVRLVKEIRPKYFILENVASMAKDQKAIMEKELFGIEAIMINATLVSAQNRRRIFIVGKRIGDTYVKVEIPQPKDRGILLRDILESSVDEKYYIKDKSNTIRTSGRGSGVDDKHNWDTIRIGHLNSGGQGDRIYSQGGKSTTLSANGGGRGAKTGLYHIPHGYKKEDITEENKYPTLCGQDPRTKHLLYPQIRKLSPIECLRLQSMPDDYFDKAIANNKPISNAQKYKMVGNAFNCEVIKHILKNIK